MLKINTKNNIYHYDSKTNEIFVDKKLVIPCVKESNATFTLDKKQKIKKIVINITEKCNLRCHYCVYGGSYFYERTHSLKNVKVSDCIKVIKNLIVHNCIEPIFIQFYGGEPLLNFSAIESIVEKLAEYKNVEFSISTNGTLLEKYSEYLIKNNFQIWVSIDGPEDIHDRYRVFPDGSGTFKSIISGLKCIKNTNREFYDKNVFFILTLAPPYMMKRIEKFIFDNEFINSKKIILNYINTSDTNFFEKHDIGSLSYHSNSFQLQLENIKEEFICESIKENSEGGIGFLIWGDLIRKIHNRVMFPGDVLWLNGCCAPGTDKIFLDTDGNVYPCERSSSFFSLGLIDETIDCKKSLKFVEQYVENANITCPNCDARQFCDFCFISFKGGSGYNFKKKKKLCDNKIREIKSGLYIYLSVLEQNPNSFNFLRELI